MLIECLIKREGPTHVTIAGFDYVFAKNAEGRKVCEVLSTGHQNHLLELQHYVPYVPSETAQNEATESTEEVSGAEAQEGPERGSEDENMELSEVETRDEVPEGLILNAKGLPFANEAVAKRAMPKYEEELEVVPYKDGFALQRKA